MIAVRPLLMGIPLTENVRNNVLLKARFNHLAFLFSKGVYASDFLFCPGRSFCFGIEQKDKKVFCEPFILIMILL
ncbi:hypothetical protein CH373_14280 [Leptospira perolatii]|uniref:Uncharacterized protein n=1 Tax=Leptospira perolatii TaxID=2023191 RepID=A0A2M9ZJT8_9LEPT|nr:hypothetical protein CH360_12340 [Leptospira perolatii]PJZ72325.1 hypothetical protein CH373_14280 [Leptospira perolatii]